MRLIFERKPGHTLIVDGKTIRHGETFTARKDVGERLMALYRGCLREVTEAGAGAKKAKRAPKGLAAVTEPAPGDTAAGVGLDTDDSDPAPAGEMVAEPEAGSEAA